jgi:mannosyltransferase OCH1-like enzyme
MIENNIHQIWVGEAKIPAHIQEYMDEVKERHKDFNYFLWTDANLPVLPEHLKKIYDSYQKPALKADLLRMYIVYKVGGFYLDADFETIDGFYSDVIPKDRDGFIVYNDSYQMAALANTLFGFKRESPLLKYMIDNITHDHQWIGPNWWSQIICKYFELNNEQTTVEELREKLNSVNLQVIHWNKLEEHCFKHDALQSWIDGSDWNEKLKNGDYD